MRPGALPSYAILARALAALLILLAQTPLAGLGQAARAQVVSEGERPAADVSGGDAVSERPDSVSVTVYRGGDLDGIAQITETRTIEITQVNGRVSFRGVADGLVPQTVAIEGLPGRLKERNEDYDLISPGAVLAKSVGEAVTLVRTNPRTGAVSQERGVVRSGPNGVVIDFGDHVEALQCSGLPERLVFDRTPPGLTARPTLSVTLVGARPGRYRVTLSYLATGLSWEAHYVARLGADDGRAGGRTLELTGWMTLKNEGAVGFEQAGTSVVAGDLNMTGETQAPEVPLVTRSPGCWPTRTTHDRHPPPPPPPPPAPYASGDVSEVVVTGSRLERKDYTAVSPVTTMASEESFADYHLYRLPGPTTVAARQTKQVMLLDRPGAPYEIVYTHRVYYLGDQDDTEENQAGVMLRLDHRRGGPLDLPLPRGTVAVVETGADGGMLLGGEGEIGDRPVGPPVEIDLGETETVTVKTRVVSDTHPGKGRRRRTVEVTLTNLRLAPVVFELRQWPGEEGFKLIAASRGAGRLHGDLMWRVTLQPGKPVVVRYTVETTE